MFKYFFVVLVLSGLILGGFQNCGKSEFTSNSGQSIPGPPVVDPPVEIQSFNLANYPVGDICVEENQQKIFTVEVIDGGYEHKIVWKKKEDDKVLSDKDLSLIHI